MSKACSVSVWACRVCGCRRVEVCGCWKLVGFVSKAVSLCVSKTCVSGRLKACRVCVGVSIAVCVGVERCRVCM